MNYRNDIKKIAFCSVSILNPLLTDRRIKYLYNLYIKGNCTEKLYIYINQGPTKPRFPLNVADRRRYGWTFVSIEWFTTENRKK